MKLNEAVSVGIFLFIVVIVGALKSEEAEAEDFKLNLNAHMGQAFNTSDARTGGFGATLNDKWNLDITYVGQGETKWGTHPNFRVTSINRLIYPGWMKDTFYISLGLARVDLEENSLVGPNNFRPSFGWDFGEFKLFYAHISSGGVYETNSGVDMLSIMVEL